MLRSFGVCGAKLMQLEQNTKERPKCFRFFPSNTLNRERTGEQEREQQKPPPPPSRPQKPTRLMATESSTISTAMLAVSSAAMRLPRYLASITMDDTQRAELLSEKAMALPRLRSVYCRKGLRKSTSAPWHM